MTVVMVEEEATSVCRPWQRMTMSLEELGCKYKVNSPFGPGMLTVSQFIWGSSGGGWRMLQLFLH